MSDKITNENKQNNLLGDKGKTSHISPYSSFYGSSTSANTEINQPSTTGFPQQQSNYYKYLLHRLFLFA